MFGPGSQQVFMSPLSVHSLPGLHPPCMRQVLGRLDDLNLETLGDVADSPLDALVLAVGDYAAQLSRGDHTAQVYPNLKRVLTFVRAELSRGQ